MNRLAAMPSRGPFLKAPRMEDPKHLDFIRTLPCVHTGRIGVEACHLRSSCLPLRKRHTGGGERPSDKYVLPMVPELHRKQHDMNEVRFWKAMGWDWQDVVQLALAIHENTGDEEACMSLIARARR